MHTSAETARPLNLAGKIGHFFAANRPLSFLVLGAVVAFGAAAFAVTPKQYNPEITRPAFALTLRYDGADIEAALSRVVYELVEKVRTVPGVDEVLTEVEDGAVVRTTVIFEVGYDPVKAKLDLRAQLAQHSYLARGFIAFPEIREIDPETIPVLQVVFTSARLSLPALREEVVRAAQGLVNVEGVSAIEVVGGYAPHLRVELDPARLQARGVSVEEVYAALKASQFRMVAPAVSAGGQKVEVAVEGAAARPEEVRQLTVAPGVRIKDVASVYLGAPPERTYVAHYTRGGGGEAVMLAVSKVEGSNAPSVTKAVLRELAQRIASRESGAQLSYRVVLDDGVTAAREIYGLTRNLVTSIAIVAGVLLLFLSFRAAVVVLIAIPATFLAVFGAGYLAGQTINRITLFALILSLGLLVDAAIVAVENIHARLTAEKKEVPPRSPARARLVAGAMDEVGMGLLLSMVTSVIVFLPMRYITGMMGPYMGPIAFFVPVALAVSFVVAIVVTPFVAAYLLRRNERPFPLARAVRRALATITERYAALLARLLRSPRAQRRLLLGLAGAFLVTLLLPASGLVHFQMLPKADREQFYVYVDLPAGTHTARTKEVAARIADLLLADEAVVDVQAFVARAPVLDFNGMFKGAQNRARANQATLRVNLTPTEERRESSTDIVTRLREKVQRTLPEGRFARFMEDPPGPPVRATLVAKVFSEDEAVRARAARALTRLFSTVRAVEDVYLSEDAPVGRAVYRVNYDALSAYGVQPEAVRRALALFARPQEVVEFVGAQEVEFVPVVATLPRAVREAASGAGLLSVKNSRGDMVPLSALIQTEYALRPSVRTLEEGERVTYVTAEVVGHPVIYAVLGLLRQLMAGEMEGYRVASWGLWGLVLNTPEGASVRLSWGGEWKMTLENFRDLSIAMLVALLLVYAVLVAQYRSFAKPAFILVTVPLGLIGIVWGFLFLDQLFGIYLTATALIGFIALIGIVVNNAIIYLEYVEQEIARGAAPLDALVAAGRARLRPILLTSLTTVMGSLTIVADPVWSGLAWSIVFGLSLSTLLTLVVYPTLLVFFRGVEGESRHTAP